MNKKKLRQATDVLQKRLNQMMTQAEQDALEWFVDRESELEYAWKFRNPADGAVTEMVYGYRSKTVIVDGTPTVEQWEGAWNNYIFRLNRIEELKAIGRYGYQLRMPYMALHNAVKRLREVDPNFCKRNGI